MSRRLARSRARPKGKESWETVYYLQGIIRYLTDLDESRLQANRACFPAGKWQNDPSAVKVNSVGTVLGGLCDEKTATPLTPGGRRPHNQPACAFLLGRLFVYGSRPSGDRSALIVNSRHRPPGLRCTAKPRWGRVNGEWQGAHRTAPTISHGQT